MNSLRAIGKRWSESKKFFWIYFFLKHFFFSSMWMCILLSTKFETEAIQRNRAKTRHQHRHRHHPKISHEIYKSFSFIHLIAVFWHFPFISAHPFHSLARFSVCCFHTFRSFYWFESAKKLILLVIVRCFSFFLFVSSTFSLWFCFALCAMYLPAMTINFSVLLVYVCLNPAKAVSRL